MTASPPVQPICSSTSGTGSVSTMCEDVTESRERSGRTPRVAALRASTAAPARTRADAVSATTSPGPLTRSARTRECSWMARPRSMQPAPQAEREPRRLHGRVVGDEHAAAEARRVAAGADGGDRRARAPARAARRRGSRRAWRPRPRSSTPSRSRAARTRRRRPRTRTSRRSRARWPTTPRTRRAPARRRSARAATGIDVHSVSQKPPLRPLGPWPQTSASSSTTRQSGARSSSCHAVHMPV